jgi:zinc transport system substrate-binding protein
MSVALRRGSLLLLAGGIMLLLGLAGCTRAPDSWREAKSGQKRILVTFAPLYCLTQAVAGEDGYVQCFLSTEGPHDYTFSPTDAVKARSAELLIYNGLGLDDQFAEKVSNFQRKPVPMLDVGAALPKNLLLKDEDDDDDAHAKKNEKHAADEKGEKAGHKHEHAKADAKPHTHGEYDPHIWLGPPQAMAMVDAIASKLTEIDPEHAKGYKERATKLKQNLKQLLEDGRAKFEDKKNRNVLTMHESFIYFAKAFDLEVAGAIQAQPNQPVDAARLAKLEKQCREKHVRVITYEPQYNPTEPKMLQEGLTKRGLKVQLVEFDPLETAPVPEGKVNPSADYYFSKMRANIDHLAKALE